MYPAKSLTPILLSLSLVLTASCSKDDDKGRGNDPTVEGAGDTPAEVTPAEVTPKPVEATPAVEEKSAAKCGATECPCEEGSKNKEGDAWDICKLSSAVEIQGHSCAAGRVVFHGDGKLQECKLTADAEIDGKPCRATPSTTAFYDDGTLRGCAASEDLEVGDYKIKKYQQISIYKGGALRQAFLKEETREIDGIQCTGGLRWFEDGKLQMCTLASDQEIEGNKLKQGTMLVKHASGNIRGLHNEKPIKWGTQKYNQKDRGNWLCFKDNKPDPEGFNCNSF
jgi:hypothetical protein